MNPTRLALRPQRRLGLAGASLVAALIGSLGGCAFVGGSTADNKPDIAALSSKAQVDCTFNGVEQMTNKPTCYEVTVPEDWSASDASDPVVLAVAVFSAATRDSSGTTTASSTSEAARRGAEPMIYLNGGPGGESIEALPYSETMLVTPFVDDRDVIIFDQRGVGRSTPNLDCRELDAVELGMNTGEFGRDQYPNRWNQALTTCHDRLTGEGTDLAAYNTIASVRDLEAIRIQLGYDQFNVLGVSYGTRLAQTYMRLYPDSLNAVVIDSVMPVEANVDEHIAQNVKRSFETMFEACAKDPGCSQAYPTFEQDLFDLLDELDNEPAVVDVTDADGVDHTYQIDGDGLLDLLFSLLYDKESFQTIPRLIAEVGGGNYDLLGYYSTIDLISSSFVSAGMHASVFCNEEVPFESEQRMDANVPTEGEYQRFDYFAQAPNDFTSCELWSAGTAPKVENEPVNSDVPTLVLAGSFDPITPPSYAKQVADHLSNSHFFEFPTEGHGEIAHACGAALASAFFNDPSRRPDGSCIDDVPAPQWVVPDPVLVPFKSADSPMAGVRPDSWTEEEPGTFARQSTPVDQTAVIVEAIDGADSATVQSYFNVDFDAADPITVDGEEWETFDGRFFDAPARLMISPDHNFYIYLTASDAEIDHLLETVAVPMAASLTAS